MEELLPELLEVMDDEESDVKAASVQALGYLANEDLLHPSSLDDISKTFKSLLSYLESA